MSGQSVGEDGQSFAVPDRNQSPGNRRMGVAAPNDTAVRPAVPSRSWPCIHHEAMVSVGVWFVDGLTVCASPGVPLVSQSPANLGLHRAASFVRVDLHRAPHPHRRAGFGGSRNSMQGSAQRGHRRETQCVAEAEHRSAHPTG